MRKQIKVVEGTGFPKGKDIARQSYSYKTENALLSKYQEVTIFYPIDMRKKRTRSLEDQKPQPQK